MAEQLADVIPFPTPTQPAAAAVVDDRPIVRLPRRGGRRLPTTSQIKATCAAADSVFRGLARWYPDLEPHLRGAGRGYPARSAGAEPGSRNHDHPDPVGNIVALNRLDVDPRLVEDILDLEAIAALAISQWGKVVRRLPGSLPGAVDVNQPRSNCSCCSRSVKGTKNDRLKDGLCGACYMAWQRWKAKTVKVKPDEALPLEQRAESMTTFIRERRQLLESKRSAA